MMVSQIDSFFVAYQKHSQILMQLGAEIEIKGKLSHDELLKMLSYLVNLWPQLGQKLQRKVFGLKWSQNRFIDEMLSTSHNKNEIKKWRNCPIDPFTQPPFQVLWINQGDRNTLAFRTHHVVVDGEAFIAVCVEALYLLAQLKNSPQLAMPETQSQLTLANVIKPLQLISKRKIIPMLRYMRWINSEVKLNRSTRLAVQSYKPDNIAIKKFLLDQKSFSDLKQKANTLDISPVWLCAAAWMRTIYKWNQSHNQTHNTTVSLEVPVSLRYGYEHKKSIGNFISPLILFENANNTLGELALALQKKFHLRRQQGCHYAIPFFTSFSRYLPWPIFRRLAINPRSTGFATSHFTWLKNQSDYFDKVAQYSNKTLTVIDQNIYTPVCLHMGAAMAVVDMAQYAQLFITYRISAFSQEDAAKLMSIFVSEIQQCKVKK